MMKIQINAHTAPTRNLQCNGRIFALERPERFKNPPKREDLGRMECVLSTMTINFRFWEAKKRDGDMSQNRKCKKANYRQSETTNDHNCEKSTQRNGAMTKKHKCEKARMETECKNQLSELEAIKRGFTDPVVMEGDWYALNLLVKPNTDLDQSFVVMTATNKNC